MWTGKRALFMKYLLAELEKDIDKMTVFDADQSVLLGYSDNLFSVIKYVWRQCNVASVLDAQ